MPARRGSPRGLRARTLVRRSLALALGAVSALALACAVARSAHPGGSEARILGADVARDVTWLADPARTGRGVGTPGNAAAGAFIAARMKEIGLQPGGVGGTFLAFFDAPVAAKLEGENALEIDGRKVALATAWQPFTFSDNGQVKGELVWAGYGITAPALGHDDYAGLDVKGKVVLVAAHFPRESDPGSQFRDPRSFQFGEWRYKAMNARDHGAAGMLAVRDDWNHPGPDDLAPWQGHVTSRAGIVAARVTAAALHEVGVDAARLGAVIDQGGDPRSRQLGLPVRLVVGIARQEASTANVIGLLPGTGAPKGSAAAPLTPTLSPRSGARGLETSPSERTGCVVVGAHYDHLGFGGESSLAPEMHVIHPGADDNASGVAALLAIAGAMAADPPPRRTVAFVAFSGEELGLLGSARFVKAPPAGCTVDDMQLMVNLDMVGRPQGGKVYVEGADTAEGGRARVARLAAEAPAISLKLAFGGDGYGPSDHTSFYARGVPVVFFFTGAHADYHRPSDTADKVDPRGLREVARLAYRAVSAAAESPQRYAVVRTPAPPGSHAGARERGSGYGAYLGSIPDFEERREPGVRLTGARPGSPADKAGLRGGDVIVKVGGTTIASLEDLSLVLRSHRPGDVVEVEWERGAEKLRAPIALGERKRE